MIVKATYYNEAGEITCLLVEMYGQIWNLAVGQPS
jgi:hypothetical protein